MEWTLFDARGTRCKITDGVIDANAQHLFANGQCHSLAISLAKSLGCEVGVVSWHAVQDDEILAEDLDVHVVAKMADGRLIDIDGVHTRDEIEAAMCNLEPSEPGVSEHIHIQPMDPEDLLEYLHTNSEGINWGPPAWAAADSMAAALIAALQIEPQRPVLEGYKTAGDYAYTRDCTMASIEAGLL